MMANTEQSYTRRRILSVAVGSVGAAALGRSHALGAENPAQARERKMILSFYCDDTSPQVAGAKAF
jgi:hypothetical protein